MSDAQRALVDRVGRRGNIDDQLGALGDQLSDGIALIQRLGPEFLVVPDIFADGDAQFLAAESEIRSAMWRAENIATRRKRRRWAAAFCAGRIRCVRLRGTRRHWRRIFPSIRVRGRRIRRWRESATSSRGSASSLSFRSRNSGRSIRSRGKIAAQTKFGKYDQVGAALCGARGEFQNFCGVAGEVADRGIDLRESDFHERPIGYGADCALQ